MMSKGAMKLMRGKWKLERLGEQVNIFPKEMGSIKAKGYSYSHLKRNRQETSQHKLAQELAPTNSKQHSSTRDLASTNMKLD